ncbi:hypothetical protein FisN_UnNu099, partial [Fistulifera solaris]
MAANLAAFNNYLRDVLFIEDAAARQAINGQGITAFDDLTHRSDKYVQEIFTKIRNPGGLIPNPAFVPPAVGAEAAPMVPAMIPNRGIAIGVNLELRVRQLRYFLFHLHRLQREFVPGFATLARLERAWTLRERIRRMRETNKDLPKIDVLLKVENARKTIEDIDEVLGNHLGAYGAPLSYLVREHVDPDGIEGVDDPGFGVPDAMSELKRNIAHADRVLSTVFYDGKARNFTFEDYCQKLNLAFLDLEEAGEVMTEDRKVRIFLDNIWADELKMSVERVRADAVLESTFENAMNYLAEQVDRKKQDAAKTRGSTRNISSVTRNSGGGNNKKGGGKSGKGKGGKAKRGKDGVPYYKWKEWIKLPKEKQEEVRNARERAKSETRNASAVETADSDSDDVVESTDAVLVYDTGETVSVEPFISSLGKVTKVPIGTVAVAYDCPTTLQTYVLFFHQSLYFSNMHRHLISPAQLRHNQVVVNETPLLHLPPEQRRPESHSILFSEPALQIPLKLMGTISYFPTRRPTDKELSSDVDCIHVNVTSESFWDPMDSNHAHDEDSLRVSLDSELRLGGQRMLGSVTSERTFVPPARSIAVISAERGSAAFDIDSYAASLTSAAISTKNRKAYVTPEDLAKRWSIGIETARRTLQRTTQRAIRDFSTVSGTRRLKPFAYQLRYPRLNTEMYCDILVGTCVSLLGNKYAAVYCTPFHWICVDPIEKKSDAHYTLDNLFRRVGVPHTLIPDNAGELTAGEFKRKAQRVQATIRPIEAHTPNANLAEDGIRELKRMYRRAMIRTNSPRCLWDLCLVYHAYVRSHSCLSIRQLDGEVPQTLLTGDTADISHICEFGWYDWVWFISPQDENMERKHLGRYLGPSFDVGDVLCARILPASGRPISRTSVFPLSVEEQNSQAVAELKAKFTQTLEQKLKDRAMPLDPTEIPEDERTPELEYYVPTESQDPEVPEIRKLMRDSMSYGTVKGRKHDQDGNPIGRYHPNPLLDTALYEIEFDTGEVEAYHANQIAEAIYAEVDDHGRASYVLKEIVDYKKESYAVPHEEAFVIHNNRKYPKRTTKGWKLCCLWNDGTTTWEKLKDLKQSHPLQLAEFAVARQIAEEPAFSWWVPYTLK